MGGIFFFKVMLALSLVEWVRVVWEREGEMLAWTLGGEKMA